MEATRPTKSRDTRVAIIVSLILGVLFLTDGVIYQDFEDDWDDERLKYGIVYIGSNIGLLNKSKEENPQFKSYFAELHVFSKSRQTPNLENFCENFDVYMQGKQVFLKINGDSTIGFLAECLKNTSNVKEKEALHRLTVLTNECDQDTVSSETILKLQAMEIQLGLILDRRTDTVQESLLECQKISIKIDFICGVVKIEGGSFYDYNTFVEVIDLKYKNTLKGISGFKPRFIFELDYQQKSWTEIYETLGLKFLYRWGMKNSQYVVHRHNPPSPKPDPTIWLPQIIFRTTINQSLMFGLRGERFGEESNFAMFEKLEICSGIKSIVLTIAEDDEANYERIADLAMLHNKFPCDISWNVVFDLNINSDSVSSKNLEFLSHLKTVYPRLIHAWLLPSLYKEEGVEKPSQLKVSKILKLLDNVSNIFNNSLAFLQYGTFVGGQLEINGIEENDNFLQQYLNTSIGLFVSTAIFKNPASIDLNTLSEQIKKEGKTPVFISMDWLINTKEQLYFTGCFLYKKYLNTVLNWAAVNSYNLALVQNDFSSVYDDPDVIVPSKIWYKSLDVFGDDFNFSNATTEELKYLSNLQDTCVTMPTEVPSTSVLFNAIYSGITMNLTSKKLSQLGSEQFAGWLDLVHFRFSSIEIIIKHVPTLRKIVQAIEVIKKDNPTSSKMHKYYLSIESLDTTAIDAYTGFYGVHFTFCRCSNDRDILQKLQKIKIRYIGVSISYDEVLNVTNDDSWKAVVLEVDYTVIRVNLAQALLMGPYIKPYSTDLNQTFYNYAYSRNVEVLPNLVFDQIRATRFNSRRIKPNITVYMQIAWPTIDYRGSTELTQRLWEYLDDFSKEFKFPFFLYQAFDENSFGKTTEPDLQYGWWRILKKEIELPEFLLT